MGNSRVPAKGAFLENTVLQTKHGGSVPGQAAFNPVLVKLILNGSKEKYPSGEISKKYQSVEIWMWRILEAEKY